MDIHYKRPKEISETTLHIETSCGTLHLILGYDDDEKTRLIEVRANIGKGGTCPNVQLDTICKLISMYLQSPEARFRIIKKFKKQFEGMNCGNPFTWEEKEYTGCHDIVFKKIIKELEKQIS